ALFQIGYSNSLLFLDPNLVEGPPVKKAPLIVRDGVAQIAKQTVSLPEGGFSDLQKWSWKDPHVVSEDGAARMSADGQNTRVAQRLKVEPWRQYHISVQIKTQDFAGAEPEIKALASGNRSLTWSSLGTQSTQNWKTHHVIFNSQDATEVQL